jgi:hypothetical protein
VEGKVMLDGGFSDEGVFEIAFNGAIAGQVFDWFKLQEWVENGRRMAPSTPKSRKRHLRIGNLDTVFPGIQQ